MINGVATVGGVWSAFCAGVLACRRGSVILEPASYRRKNVRIQDGRRAKAEQEAAQGIEKLTSSARRREVCRFSLHVIIEEN
jgi:hypothetical protein